MAKPQSDHESAKSTLTPQRLRLGMADLPKELLAAIGEVTVCWGHLVTLIDVAIWGILRLNPRRGTSLTNAFKFAGKMDMLQSTGDEFFRGKPTLEDFRTLRKRIFDCYAKRNDLEHATWNHIPPGQPGLSVRVRIRKDLSIDARPMTAKDVDAIGQEIIQLIVDLNSFMEQHIPAPANE